MAIPPAVCALGENRSRGYAGGVAVGSILFGAVPEVGVLSPIGEGVNRVTFSPLSPQFCGLPPYLWIPNSFLPLGIDPPPVARLDLYSKVSFLDYFSLR